MKRRFAVLALCLTACEPYEPVAIPDAAVQLAFEKDLDNLGSAALEGIAENGRARFKKSTTGKALYTLGDGGWAEFNAPETIALGDIVEISFDFKPANWINPYEKGRTAKTIAAVSSRGPERIRHIIFNISRGSNPHIHVYFDDAEGTKFRLRSEPGSVTTGWHSVRMRIDREAGETRLSLDGAEIASANAVSAVMNHGVDTIKLGTWHKQNQAYRGHIDNFIIRPGRTR